MTDFQTLRRIMVDTQIRPSDVTKFPIISAMLEIPREAFVPAGQIAVAYTETALAITDDREIIEPRTLAKMLDALDVERDENVLVIGANYGYATGLLAHMATSVVAIEPDEGMAREAQDALSQNGLDNAAVMAGDLTEGHAKAGPYNVILIEGAVEHVPDSLLDQLAEGGRIGAIFMEGAAGQARIGIKSEGRVTWRFAFNAAAPILEGFAKEKAFSL